MRVIAIDPGTQCGWAYTDDNRVHVEQSGVWDLKPNKKAGSGERYLRFEGHLLDLMSVIDDGVECVVYYESVVRHKGTTAAHIYGGWKAIIEKNCEEYDAAYFGVGVGEIKIRATGKGNANKQAMIDAAKREWVDGMVFTAEQVPHDISHDRADAMWILQCGLDELGLGEG